MHAPTHLAPIAALALAATASAGDPSFPIYRIDIEGVVSIAGEKGGLGPLAAEFSAGESVTVSLFYDGGATPDAGGANTADYFDDIIGLAGVVGDYVFGLLEGPSLNEISLVNGTSGGDFFTFETDVTGPDVGTIQINSFFLSLNDPEDEAFPSDPPAPPGLDIPIDFEAFGATPEAKLTFFAPAVARGGGGGGGDFFDLRFDVTSITSTQVSDPRICRADFDGDGDVDLGDFGIFGSAFGAVAGELQYEPAADFDNDGDVDLGDFGIFGTEFGHDDCNG